jgi:hypothetical protein
MIGYHISKFERGRLMRRSILIVLLMVVFLAGHSLYGAEKKDPSSLEGIWEGILRIPGASAEGGGGSTSNKLKIFLTFAKNDDGTYACTMDSPDQGARGIPVDEVTLEENEIFLDIKAMAGNFKGKLDKDGSKIKGYWQQQGNPPMPLSFKYAGAMPDTQPTEEIYTGPETDALSSQATAFVALLAKEDYKKAVKDFSDAMNEKLPPEKLQELWNAIIAQAGPFKKQAGTRITEIMEYHPVYVTCEFEKVTLDLKVAIDGAKKIAGLSVVPSQAAAEK